VCHPKTPLHWHGRSTYPYPYPYPGFVSVRIAVHFCEAECAKSNLHMYCHGICIYACRHHPLQSSPLFPPLATPVESTTHAPVFLHLHICGHVYARQLIDYARAEWAAPEMCKCCTSALAVGIPPKRPLYTKKRGGSPPPMPLAASLLHFFIWHPLCRSEVWKRKSLSRCCQGPFHPGLVSVLLPLWLP